jgi:IS5 family transposase
MRAKRTSQVSLFDQFAEHHIGRELAGMSAQLDAHPVLLDFVADDLGSSAATGRCGLTAEAALRCALLKQHRQLTYDELAFHLLDSASFQAFARLPWGWTPSKAALQANIATITDATWQAISTQLVSAACEAGVERGTMWRIDSTVSAPSPRRRLKDYPGHEHVWNVEDNKEAKYPIPAFRDGKARAEAAVTGCTLAG